MSNSNGKMDWDEVMSGSRSASGPPSRTRAGATGRGGTPPPPATRSSRGGGSSGQGRRRAAASGGDEPPKRSLGKRIGLGIVFTMLGVLVAGLLSFLIVYSRLDVPEADQFALAQTTTVYYNDGETEMGTFSEVNRTIIDAQAIPDFVGHAVVSSEDRTFFTNSGIDFKGIARALVNNLTGGPRQGGSTLTMQYVERYYMGDTTSYVGKAKEAVLAIKINREQTKDEILGNYLNTIYFGRGAYGIEAAAKSYFGVPASELTLSQGAMLAGIIPAPSAWDPALDPEQAQGRWERVLGLMVEDGWISQADANAAVFPETLPLTEDTSSMTGTTGYLMQQVRAELQASSSFSDEQIDSGGLRIITTVDKAKQDAAVAAAESMFAVEGWDQDKMRVALSSMDPNTGEILAEYAGSDYQKRQQNAVTQDRAMAGSTFKVFALLAHAQQGGSIQDMFDGRSPETFDGLAEPVYNDGDYSWGERNLIDATRYSINTAYVDLNEKVGPGTTEKVAIEAGIPQDTLSLEPTLLNVLGFAAPHNIDITRAYGTLATGGLTVTPHMVREVRDTKGSIVYTAVVAPSRAFEVNDVSEILPALQGVMESGGTGEKATVLGRPSGGKTGTSENQMSAQFVGFIPQMVTTVSMYQTGPNGEQEHLDNIGGLGQFHGGDWPADVWVHYMH